MQVHHEQLLARVGAALESCSELASSRNRPWFKADNLLMCPERQLSEAASGSPSRARKVTARRGFEKWCTISTACSTAQRRQKTPA